MLTSSTSTQEALRLFLIGNGSENTLADEIPYVSSLFDKKLRLDLLLKDDEPETIVKVLDTIKGKTDLTEEEIIDLKVAFFQIADALERKHSLGLMELYKRAFSK